MYFKNCYCEINKIDEDKYELVLRGKNVKYLKAFRQLFKTSKNSRMGIRVKNRAKKIINKIIDRRDIKNIIKNYFSMYNKKRPSSRILRISRKLKMLWSLRSEERLCQLIVNLSRINDPFYVEDDEMESRIDNAIKDSMRYNKRLIKSRKYRPHWPKRKYRSVRKKMIDKTRGHT